MMRTPTRKPTPKPTTIDAYLTTVKGEKRLALDKLRKTIRAVVPKAEECISYRLPAFRLDGKVIAGFCATTKGCSYFPFSGRTLQTLAGDLEALGGRDRRFLDIGGAGGVRTS